MVTRAEWNFYVFNVKIGIRAFLKNIDYFRFREYLMTFKEINHDFNSQLRYSLLDIGCGEEVFGIFLAKTKGWEVTVVDMNEQKISFQNKCFKRLKDEHTVFKAETADATKMPYSDGNFDAVTCFAVAPLIEGEGDTRLLQEIGRVLKDDGRAYVTVGYGLQYQEQWNSSSTKRIFKGL